VETCLTLFLKTVLPHITSHKIKKQADEKARSTHPNHTDTKDTEAGERVLKVREAMVLQDKYKRANSSRYRATHGGMESNRQLRAKAVASASSASPSHHFPPLVPADPSPSSSSSLADHPPPSVDNHLLPTPSPSSAFARRVLASNADRYLEPDPDPNLDKKRRRQR